MTRLIDNSIYGGNDRGWPIDLDAVTGAADRQLHATRRQGGDATVQTPLRNPYSALLRRGHGTRLRIRVARRKHDKRKTSIWTLPGTHLCSTGRLRKHFQEFVLPKRLSTVLFGNDLAYSAVRGCGLW